MRANVGDILNNLIMDRFKVFQVGGGGGEQDESRDEPTAMHTSEYKSSDHLAPADPRENRKFSLSVLTR